MKLFKLKKTFVKDEDGAVTVDWVVLTAAIVGIGLIVLQIIRGGIIEAASSIREALTDAINKHNKPTNKRRSQKADRPNFVSSRFLRKIRQHTTYYE